MSEKTKKIWEKPWTTEEIISKADNWSLAGDVALLHSFEKFAHNMFLKTNQISKNLDDLLDNTDEVQLKLSMCQNEFHSLKNTQFIESRVYEDDETLDSREIEKAEENILPEEEKEKIILDAIADGLKVMEEYYDEVEVDVSDSEEETDKSFILKPKDIYAHRQLPPMIGTDEWFKKWHCDEESSDSESDKVLEVYSESDSEECLPKHLLKGSETSSEMDSSSHVSVNLPPANSGTTIKKQMDISSSEESSDGKGSLPVKTLISNQSFAEQLSAKLGNVVSQRQDIAHIKEDINKRPIQATTNTNYVGGLFPDEPPPLDRTEDSLSKSNKDHTRLFDENDDDLFWGQRPKPRFGRDALFGQDDAIHQPVKKEEGNPNATKTQQIARGLFDSDNSSDESDIFAGNATALSKPPFLQAYKTSAPLFDDSPPDLDAKIKDVEPIVDKKPVGGVSIFGNTNIFANQTISDVLENKRAPRNANESNVEQNKTETNPKPRKIYNDKKPTPIPSLFDDELEDDEVDFTLPQKKVGSSETDNKRVSAISKKLDLFDDSVLEEDTDKSSSVVSKKVSLFDDSVSDEEKTAGNRHLIRTKEKSNVKSEIITQKKTNLFAEEKETHTVTSKKVSLFDDSSSEKDECSSNKITASTSKKISLFDDDDDLFKDDIFSSLVTPPSSGKWLFDDLDDADGDLFSVNKSMDKKSEVKSQTGNKKISLFSDNEDEEDIFESKTIKSYSPVDEPKKTVSLFSDTEDVTERGKIEAELTSSKAGKADKTEQEEVMTSSSETKMVGADVGNDTSDKDLKKEMKTDDTKVPKKVDYEIPQKDETFTHTQSSNQMVSEAKEAEIKDGTLFESQSSDAILSSTKEEPKEQKPIISLFSSAPPSDDEDDWDTKSDNMSDTDDYRPYSIDDNISRSSLFDNEPPSLNPNESSGIVRDQNVTRVDSDDSSFYPHASSSKRFSSDIFAEQQSQDKFFVTGSTNHSSVFPSSTESSSITEVTNKIISDIMGDTSFLITDNTLESTSTAHGLTEELSTATDDVKTADECIKIKTTKIKAALKQENSENAASMKIEKGDGDSSKISSKRGSPLKLKPSLNINVSALLPGSAPPKLKTPRVSDTSDKGRLDCLAQKKPVQTVDNHVEKKLKDSISSVVPPPLPTSVEEYVEKPISFNDSLEKVEVLHSVTKDRVRIPIKRKPSTRQARQEAARNSAIFLEAGEDSKMPTRKDTSILEKDVINKEKIEAEKGSSKTSKTLLFNEDIETSSETGTEIKKTKSTSLFENSDENEIFQDNKKTDSTPNITTKPSSKTKSEDEDLFPSTPKSDYTDSKKGDVTSPSVKEKYPSKSYKANIDSEKTEVSLFDESLESEEDDFFKRTSKKSIKTKSSLFDSGDESDSNLFGSKMIKGGSEKKSKPEKLTKKKSLFDDSSSDDDLFSSGKSKNTISGTDTKLSERTKRKSSSLKKLDKDEASEDPLSKLSG